MVDAALSEADIQARLDQGIDEFNDEAFFEAHDTLEDVWMDVRGQERLFFQGLIQLAIGYYHLTCENYPGAEHLLSRGLEKLDGFRPSHRGVRLGPLVEVARSTRDTIASRSGLEVWVAPVIERDAEG